MRMIAHINSIAQPITNLERLSQALRKTRRARGISQQMLAELAGISRRTVSNAEAAENVGLKELSQMANALGLELALRPKNTVVFEDLVTVFKDEE